jgi:ribosome biogenesis protein MAK21
VWISTILPVKHYKVLVAKMARDFRPKAAKKEAKFKSPQSAKEAQKSDTRPGKKDDSDMASHNVEEGDDEDDEDDETLLREIRSLGGDESDLKLIKEAATSSRRNLDEDDDLDPALHKELQSFMKGLDFKAAAATAIHDVEEEDVHAETGVQEKQKKEAKKDKNGQQTEGNLEPTRGSAAQDVVEVKRRGPAGFVVVPSSRWAEIGTPDLSSLGSKANSKPTDAVISAMQEKANQMLSSERTHYSQLTNSGKTGSGGDGLLSASDAKFVADLLGSGSRSGTLSDRVAALTLLAQTSPIHNFDSLEKLLDMSGKKGREESGKATRSLGDWLASDVGLPDRKLRYFRDQPNLEILAATYNDVSLKGKERLMIDLSLVLFAFEDRLKRFYFDYLAILERQSHDTLPFVRKQAAGQIFVLLRDKPEQEQNLLRLLVNKLGDTDRSVASKASSHLLSLLNTHPAMKAVVTNEVSNLVLQAPSALSRKGKGQPNAHAQYYGILTLNQTMLTNNDATVANNLINLYFTLFEGLLRELAEHEAPKSQEKIESTVTDSKPQVPRKDKGRWRDTGRGGKKLGPKGGPRKDKEKASTPVQDADARIMAAILAGVRRALPFAKMDGVVIDKHMDTLFRITHSSTFNISIQALQLIFQVSNAGSATRGSSSASAIASSTNTQDRFYRTLYASMLDPRLAKTSKQAMYLNLLFKATKADLDDARCKAFVKRLCQLLTNSEPPFVCGSLFLLGELFRAKPGLRSMLNDAEEDGEEHFVDVDEEQADASLVAGVERNVLSLQALQQQRQRSGYDGDKRDPRYARAEHTCLWDLTPLLSHFHPSVALCAKQLLLGEQISTTADLTLHSLSHFLDRFVYRNPKKHVAASKGSSLMQPALHVNDSLETGVARLRGHGIAKEEFVNSDAFWRKKLVDVPVDQVSMKSVGGGGGGRGTRADRNSTPSRD